MRETKTPDQPPFPWFAEPWRRIVDAVKDGRLAQSALISGPGGVGAENLAVAIGHYLLCVAPLELHSCGHCKSCALLRAGTHPDFHLVGPEDAGKAIKIDQIRAITQAAASTSQQGGRKVIVISPAEQMNRNAANALLKVLEEPNSHCYFLLVSAQPGRILATIRSRCTLMPVSLPDPVLAMAWLEEQGVEESKARLDEVGGRPLRVLEWQANGLFKKKALLVSTVGRLLNGEISDIECARQLTGMDLGWVIDELLVLVASNIRTQVEGRQSPSAAGGALGRCGEGRLHPLYQSLLRRKHQLQMGTNLNADIFLADLVAEILEISLPMQPLSAPPHKIRFQ